MIRSRCLRAAEGFLSLAGLLGMSLGMVSLAALVALIATEVVMRSIFGRSLLIVEEVSGYLLVSLVFLTLPRVAQTHGFVRIDIFYGRLPREVKAVVDGLMSLTALAYALVLWWFVSTYVLRNYQTQTQAYFFFDVPIWLPQTAMVIGTGLLVLVLARDMAAYLAGVRNSTAEGTHADPCSDRPVEQGEGRRAE